MCGSESSYMQIGEEDFAAEDCPDCTKFNTHASEGTKLLNRGDESFCDRKRKYVI